MSQASQTTKKVRLVLLEEATNPNPNLPKSGSDKWSVLALFENIIHANEKSCLLHAFPNLKYLLIPQHQTQSQACPIMEAEVTLLLSPLCLAQLKFLKHNPALILNLLNQCGMVMTNQIQTLIVGTAVLE